MSIIRRRVNKDFFSVPNKPFTDDGISLEARGALAYLLSKPDDWKADVKDLMNQTKNCPKAYRSGRDKIYRILQELETAGYMIQRPILDPKTRRFVGFERVVYDLPELAAADLDSDDDADEPLTDDPDTAQPDTVGPDTARPVPAQPDAYKILNTTKTENATKTEGERTNGVGQPARAARTLTPQQELFGAICEACDLDPSMLSQNDSTNVGALSGDLKAKGVTPDQVRQAGQEWVTVKFAFKAAENVTAPGLAAFRTWMGSCLIRWAKPATIPAVSTSAQRPGLAQRTPSRKLTDEERQAQRERFKAGEVAHG